MTLGSSLHSRHTQAPLSPRLGAVGEPSLAAVRFKATDQSGELDGTAIQVAVILASISTSVIT